jgi:hypothetical protein
MHHSYESFERSELVMKLKGDLDQLKVRVYSPKKYKKTLLITLIELIYAASTITIPLIAFLHYGIILYFVYNSKNKTTTTGIFFYFFRR